MGTISELKKAGYREADYITLYDAGVTIHRERATDWLHEDEIGGYWFVSPEEIVQSLGAYGFCARPIIRKNRLTGKVSSTRLEYAGEFLSLRKEIKDYSADIFRILTKVAGPQSLSIFVLERTDDESRTAFVSEFEYHGKFSIHYPQLCYTPEENESEKI